jgi:hypothetical protein
VLSYFAPAQFREKYLLAIPRFDIRAVLHRVAGSARWHNVARLIQSAPRDSQDVVNTQVFALTAVGAAVAKMAEYIALGP